MKPEVLVLRTNGPRTIELLGDAYTLHRYDCADDPARMLADVGRRIEAVVTTGSKTLGREILDHLPNCRLIASSGVGYDAIDVAACSERGIRVTNTPDVLTGDVADLAIGLLIAARRALVEGDRYVRSGTWGRNGPMRLTHSIGRAKLGIVGLGRIGKAIARRAEPMGVEIAYFGRNRDSRTPYRFEPDLTQLAKWADILVVALAGGTTTAGLVNADIICALGPTGTLINVSRGAVVDEAALIAALRDGDLGSAGLDVFLNEPEIDQAFTRLENVVLHPHHASGTVEAREAMARLMIDNLRAHFAGEPLLTPVN